MPPQSFDFSDSDAVASYQSFKPAVPPCGVLHEAFAHTVDIMHTRDFQMAMVHAAGGRAFSFAELHATSSQLGKALLATSTDQPKTESPIAVLLDAPLRHTHT